MSRENGREAARLFINTLGADQDLAYRLGVIAFGAERLLERRLV